MKFFKPIDDGFSGLKRRDRFIVAVAVAAGIAFVGNQSFLKPQRLEINTLQAKFDGHQKELAGFRKALADIKAEADSGIDPHAKARAELAELKKQIAETTVFLAQADSTTSQVGILVRNLIKSNPGLQLVSLKTMPGAVFYTPPPPPPPPKKTAGDGIADVLSKVKQEEVKKAPEPIVLVKKTLYKHGVDVTVKGTYPALMSYLQEMQKLPERIFWSEVKLDVNETNHREATLKLLIYTLSDQMTPPLN